MDGASLVLMTAGALDQLNALRTSWLATLRVGLFQNDWTPHLNSVIGHVVPATFSGYDGLHDAYGWGAAALFGELAVTQAGANAWTHNGGAVANWVYGYYVVNAAGALCWAQRDPDGPADVSVVAVVYGVLPRYAVKSRFLE